MYCKLGLVPLNSQRGSVNLKWLSACQVLLPLLALALGLSGGPAAGQGVDKDHVKRATEKELELESKRRADAMKEWERIKGDGAKITARIEEAKRWAMKNFELGERGQLPKPQRVSGLMQGWQRQRDTMKRSFLEFSDKHSGAIQKGTALNFFVDVCGATAQEHAFFQENQKGPEAELLKGFAAQYVIEEDIWEHLRMTRGQGQKETRRLNSDPLELEWPVVLRAPEYGDYRDRIERARNRGLAELRDGHPIGFATVQELKNAVDEFTADFNDATKNRVRQTKTYDIDTAHMYLGKRYLNNVVRPSVYKFIEANNIKEVRVREDFKDGTVEKLMAYMYRNNLQFGEAGPNDYPAYDLVFKLITGYYVDLHAMKLALDADERELAKLDREGEKMLDVALGNAMNNFQKERVWTEGLKAGGQVAEAFTEGFRARRQRYIKETVEAAQRP